MFLPSSIILAKPYTDPYVTRVRAGGNDEDCRERGSSFHLPHGFPYVPPTIITMYCIIMNTQLHNYIIHTLETLCHVTTCKTTRRSELPHLTFSVEQTLHLVIVCETTHYDDV